MRFDGQSLSALTGEEGRWSVKLASMKVGVCGIGRDDRLPNIE